LKAEAGVIDKSGGSKPDSWRLTTGTRAGSSPEFHGRVPIISPACQILNYSAAFLSELVWVNCSSGGWDLGEF
jgi:hypothetical protein